MQVPHSGYLAATCKQMVVIMYKKGFTVSRAWGKSWKRTSRHHTVAALSPPSIAATHIKRQFLTRCFAQQLLLSQPWVKAAHAGQKDKTAVWCSHIADMVLTYDMNLGFSYPSSFTSWHAQEVLWATTDSINSTRKIRRSSVVLVCCVPLLLCVVAYSPFVV